MWPRYQILTAIWVSLGVCFPPIFCAQNAQHLLTDDVAAKQFIYEGNPVHPFCIEFPLERSSRSGEMNLDDCMDTTVRPRRGKNGWLNADHTDAGATLHGTYSSYKVFAKDADKFLIGTSISGGGSGIFDSLMWVQLRENHLAVVSEEPGGDRCSGGIADDYQIEGASLHYSRFVTPVDIVELSGIKSDAVEQGLEQTPVSCFGRAYYVYDLLTRSSKLVSVRLHAGFARPSKDKGKAEPGLSQDAGDDRYQRCFNRLFNDYIDKRKVDLNTVELKEFGKKFAAARVDSQ